ncbi:hypothetical protein B0H10DRAFT_1962483 [Mycena sp. CBHHK59/15]|nr:hypothetical protein B0H10DRAFT_1962483 [Mycena sp. CBHHK59/15]
MQRKSKTTKVDSLKFGPLALQVCVTWDSFLESVAIEIEAPAGTESLLVSSFEWHFSKPKPTNASWVPLKTAKTFTSMINQILAKLKKDPSTYIILKMQPPTPPRATVPWGVTVDKILGIPVDEDVLSDDGGGPMQKKARFDDELEELVEEIRNMYPPGT